LNGISRKLRELEQSVLKLPEDSKINLYIKDNAEMALHERAHKIREPLQEIVKNIIFNGKLTFEQQNAELEEVFKELSETEQRIISESEKFICFRLMRLNFKEFSPMFLKIHHKEVWQRIVWFFEEMKKLVVAKAVEDSEWNFHRNENDPDFDDFKWWDNVEAKIREVYPKGVFTQESYEAVRDYFDEKESEAIRQYWKENPEKFREYMKHLEKKLERIPKTD
jgi:hypothetical protein